MLPLINPDCIRDWLIVDDEFHVSHHATPTFLGGGMLYYAFAYLLQAKRCVCLGSGGGFVPRVMRQAQFDLGILDSSETILIDANLPEVGWGEPNYHDQPTFFSNNTDVRIIKKTTKNALPEMQGKIIDYLHIDADHSYEWVKHDFFAYLPLMRPHGIMTLHDSMVPETGVSKLVHELHELGWGIASVQIGTGVAIVRVDDLRMYL